MKKWPAVMVLGAAILVALAIPESARGAAQEAPSWKAQGTISIAPHRCLTAVQDDREDPFTVRSETCVPGAADQQWTAAQYQEQVLIVVSTAYPTYCLGGVPVEGNQAGLHYCFTPGPSVIVQGLYITGGGGSENTIENQRGQRLAASGNSGSPAVWASVTDTQSEGLLDYWTFNGGWEPVE